MASSPGISIGSAPPVSPKPPQQFPGKPDPSKPGRCPAKGDPAYNPDVPKVPKRPLPQR